MLINGHYHRSPVGVQLYTVPALSAWGKLVEMGLIVLDGIIVARSLQRAIKKTGSFEMYCNIYAVLRR